ncbi:MAG: hypothetical protein IPP87_15040 [Ideonella sp.]|nr:hypothetical protein [Ideonella sp.]
MSPNIRSASTSENPMIAFNGVRSSWLMLARNSDLCWLAISSWWLLAWISLNRRAFSIAITAWSAKVFSRLISSSENGCSSLRETRIAPTPRSCQISGANTSKRVPVPLRRAPHEQRHIGQADIAGSASRGVRARRAVRLGAVGLRRTWPAACSAPAPA